MSSKLPSEPRKALKYAGWRVVDEKGKLLGRIRRFLVKDDAVVSVEVHKGKERLVLPLEHLKVGKRKTIIYSPPPEEGVAKVEAPGVEIPETPELEAPKAEIEVPEAKPVAKKTPAEEAVSDILEVIERAVTLHERRLKLIELFTSGRIRESVFEKIFNEYEEKIKRANEELLRLSKVVKQQKIIEYDKAIDELKEAMEEVEARHYIGELSDEEYQKRLEELKSKLNDVLKQKEVEISSLTGVYDVYTAIARRKDLISLAQERMERLKELLEKGEISKELGERIKDYLRDLLEAASISG